MLHHILLVGIRLVVEDEEQSIQVHTRVDILVVESGMWLLRIVGWRLVRCAWVVVSRAVDSTLELSYEGAAV